MSSNLNMLIDEGFTKDPENKGQYNSHDDMSTTCWYDEDTDTLYDFSGSGIFQCQCCNEIFHYCDHNNEAVRNSSEWICDGCYDTEE